jgi:hypothetical protein
MNKHKTIQNKFKSWGRSKQEIPPNNDVLKREILSRVSINFDRTISPKRNPLMWLPFAFTAMALFVLLINFTDYSNNVGKQNTQTQLQTESLSTSGVYKSAIPSVLPYERGQSSISDLREFLKVDYNATLRTRHITDLKNKAEIIIRSLDGRIDSSNSGEKNGYINFVIPKTNLESLKIEIKDLIGTRFYIEQISSQNLLPEKQAIEENQKQTETRLNNSQMERAQIIGNHNKNISSYEAEIISKNTEINILNLQYQSPFVTNKTEILNRINQLRAEINTIQSEIENENRNYREKMDGINLQIRNTQEDIKTIKSRDINLLTNVATVNGLISLNWISLWEIADVYLPGPLLAWISFLAAIVSFLWYRHSTKISYLDF